MTLAERIGQTATQSIVDRVTNKIRGIMRLALNTSEWTCSVCDCTAVYIVTRTHHRSYEYCCTFCAAQALIKEESCILVLKRS